MPAKATTRVAIHRVGDARADATPGHAGHDPDHDEVVIEEPLEIRVDDETLAITMRTPGHDRELVLGFLVSEGIVRSAADVSSLAPCGRPGDPGHSNTIAVALAPTARPPTGELVRRGTIVSSACGVCGRRSIDDLLATAPPLPPASPLRARVVEDAVASLRSRQPIFEATGGCHAASLVDGEGLPLATFEDVGRHNAVDKVVGARLLANDLGARDRLLVVSGRASFEILQKARLAGITAVASVSAPSSLAISLARESGIALAGFVRGHALVVYAGTFV